MDGADCDAGAASLEPRCPSTTKVSVFNDGNSSVFHTKTFTVSESSPASSLGEATVYNSLYFDTGHNMT